MIRKRTARTQSCKSASSGTSVHELRLDYSFRNIYTYLDDCWLQDVGPSLPQLLVMLDSAEVSLAFPGPAWLMRPLSYMMGVVVGRWFGGYVLGYKASYPEYWNEADEARKEK